MGGILNTDSASYAIPRSRATALALRTAIASLCHAWSQCVSQCVASYRSLVCLLCIAGRLGLGRKIHKVNSINVRKQPLFSDKYWPRVLRLKCNQRTIAP